VLGIDHLAKPDRNDGRIAAERPASMPWLSIGSSWKKFITSLRAWQSIQSIEARTRAGADDRGILRGLVESDDR